MNARDQAISRPNPFYRCEASREEGQPDCAVVPVIVVKQGLIGWKWGLIGMKWGLIGVKLSSPGGVEADDAGDPDRDVEEE
jgi:hypothetical protein